MHFDTNFVWAPMVQVNIVKNETFNILKVMFDCSQECLK